MKSHSSAAGHQPVRSQPGRLYAFLVIALATFVIGLTFGPWNALPQNNSTAGLTDTGHSLDWPKAQLLALVGGATVLGVVGAWLTGLGASKTSESSFLPSKQVGEATGLPVVGELFPSASSPPSSRSFRWILFPAELTLMAAVMLSFHAAVTTPTFAKEFAKNPFSAYSETVQDWRTEIDSVLERDRGSTQGQLW